MQLYLRLLKFTLIENCPESEADYLRRLLSTAPGIRQVTKLEKHYKGGYAVWLDVDPGFLDQLTDYFHVNGLCSVI